MVRLINEGNPVTTTLPSRIDNFLEGFAQVYGGITYNDITKLSDHWSDKSVSSEIKKNVNYLLREMKDIGMDLWEAAQEYDDIKASCDKIVAVIKSL